MLEYKGQDPATVPKYFMGPSRGKQCWITQSRIQPQYRNIGPFRGKQCWSTMARIQPQYRNTGTGPFRGKQTLTSLLRMHLSVPGEKADQNCYGGFICIFHHL